MAINFQEDVKSKIDLSDDKVKTISTLAQCQVDIEAEIKALGEQLKAQNKLLLKVSEEDLPAAMLAAGVSELKLADGTEINIKADIYPSIPAVKRLLAYTWLRENNYGSLIKNNVTIQFGKGEDQKAIDLLTELTAEGYNPTQKESVHPGTLKSFVKEQMADPDTPDLPEELFTVFEKSKSVVVLN